MVWEVYLSSNRSSTPSNQVPNMYLERLKEIIVRIAQYKTVIHFAVLDLLKFYKRLKVKLEHNTKIEL
jgi:hypothetical protein